MSIVTKTGDAGTTALMYGHRVPKDHPRIEACGAVDELNAAIGMARSFCNDAWCSECLVAVQQDLIGLMGEMATDPRDLARYDRDGFRRLTASATRRLEENVAQIEGGLNSPKGWATPGANPAAAALDVARAVCRRAERRLCTLRAEAPSTESTEAPIFLNRLSDLLWLMARRVEQPRD